MTEPVSSARRRVRHRRAPSRLGDRLEREFAALARRAQAAASRLGGVSTGQKNRCLTAMAQALRRAAGTLQAANARDIALARRAGRTTAFIDRLTLTPARLEETCRSLEAVAALPDPVGVVLRQWDRPNGLHIEKVRVPLGVIAIIYESRPNVTVDCAGLCLKSGNAVMLRGGREALQSNRAIADILRDTLRAEGLPEDAVIVVNRTEHEGVAVLARLAGLIDLMIPRGGEALIRTVVRHARGVPVLKHDRGVCHVFVDEEADLAMAQRICFNAKVQRPGTCNAMETLLVHRKVAPVFLPVMAQAFQDAGVELRGDEATRRLVPGIKRATAVDWATEYLDLILSVKVVQSLEEAMAHIARYGTRHSEAIVTQSPAHAEAFLNGVDAACVYANASTRLTDGFQFGLGAEMGVSTDKLHARGPVALEELTTYKYRVTGSGQLRE